MYLRTTRRKNKDGSVVEYYQLAHNIRHAETGQPVAEIIHNFGRADELDRDDLVRLCRSIARVCGVEVRDPLESSDGTPTPIVEQPAALPEDVKLIQTFELGVPFVVEALWERLKLGPALRKVMEESGGTALHERSLLAIVANRLCEPDSKLGVWDRWLQKVYMPSCNTLKLYHMSLLQKCSELHGRFLSDGLQRDHFCSKKPLSIVTKRIYTLLPIVMAHLSC